MEERLAPPAARIWGRESQSGFPLLRMLQPVTKRAGSFEPRQFHACLCKDFVDSSEIYTAACNFGYKLKAWFAVSVRATFSPSPAPSELWRLRDFWDTNRTLSALPLIAMEALRATVQTLFLRPE